ncbi:MAG: hypothetical protein AAGA78_17490, partial [Pseudomonadota bacterium]
MRGIIVVPLLVLLGVGLYLGSALNSPTDQSVAPGVQAEAPAQTPVQETDQLVIATQDPGSTAQSEGVASIVAATQDEGATVAETEVEVTQEPVPSTVEFVSPDEVREAAEDNSVAEAETLDPSPVEEGQDTLAEEAAPQTGEITTAALAGSNEDGSQSPIEVPDAKPGPTLVETPAASLPDIVSAAEDPAEPQFDLVRIEQDGAGLIAGRAEPGATVRVLSGQKEIARVEASASGEFVAFIDAPGEEEGRGLSLVAEDQAGKVARSESEVFIIPAATTGDADETPAAPAVVEASDSGVRLLQPAGLAAVDGVTLDSVSYARDGAVVLAGRAPEDADLRVYADGRALGDVKAGQTGSWDARL